MLSGEITRKKVSGGVILSSIDLGTVRDVDVLDGSSNQVVKIRASDHQY